MASSAIFDAPELTTVFPYKLPRAQSCPLTHLLPPTYSQTLQKYLLAPMLEAEQPKANTKSMSAKSAKARTTPSKRVRTKIFDWNPELAFVACLICFIAYLLSNGRGDNSGGNLYALCSGDKKIYTVDDNNSRAECIVVNGTSIIYVGDLDNVRMNWSSIPIRRVPAGAVVIPGISDSHCHILEYGASRQIPLSEGRSVKETVSFIADYIKSIPELETDKSRSVGGWGWDHAAWDIEQMPTSDDLEANPTVAGRRLILQSRDGHAIWVSRRILLENQPYPDAVPGGIIVRDEAGNPTGVFMDSAQELIKRTPLSENDLKRHFRTTVKEALSSGLTSLHDAGLTPESLAFFQRQAAAEQLPIRIYGMTYFDEGRPYWGDKTKVHMGATSDRLSSKSVKIFADGALRTGGAALYEPYADNHATNGVMRISIEVLKKVIPRFLQDGWQVNVHAIGDRANSMVLDAFESALKGTNLTTARPRLEHAQIMTKEDMRRLGELGVIASIQPTHAISDMWFALDRLGPERVKGLYAFRDIVDSGARITLGSDFPVDEINPLKGFYAAVSRLSTDGTSPHGAGGWFPNQRLTRTEALRGMTIDPAYASFTEDVLGSLVPGKRADYVVLSQDLMTVSVERILETKVLATSIDGELVFGAI